MAAPTTFFVDRCKFRAASTGTGNFVVSAAETGFLTPASAGAVDTDQFTYVAETDDHTQWEIGHGAYNTASTLLARTTVYKSSNANAAVNFSTAPIVRIAAVAQDHKTVLSSGYISFYVRTDGNDANDGRDNSAGRAFATIQRACDVVARNYIIQDPATIYILIVDGTYSLDAYPTPGTLNISPFEGHGFVVICSNSLDNTKVTLTNSNGGGLIYLIGSNYTISFMKLTSTGAGSPSLITMGAGASSVTDLDLGTAQGNHITVASPLAWFVISGNITVTGTASGGVSVGGGQFYQHHGGWTFSVDPGYGTYGWLSAADLGQITFHSSGTGAVTGPKWYVTRSGRIHKTCTDASMPGAAGISDGLSNWVSTFTAGYEYFDYPTPAAWCSAIAFSTIVASLPNAASVGAGARSFVTDATSNVFLTTVASTGSLKVPVVSDGVNWVIG